MAAIDRISTGQVTLTSTATRIVGPSKDRDGVLVVKHGSQDAYLGCSTVTTTTGVLLAGDCGIHMIYPTTDALYGVLTTGTLVVSYLEIRA